MRRLLFIAFFLFINQIAYSQIPDSPLATDVRETVWPKLQEQLKNRNLKAGQPIFIRILKQEMQLEIWVWSGKNYTLFKSYPICYFSGGLGTKTKDGDGKSPEGFYTLTPKQLNPVSHYHLAINIGYPNKMELANGYTGNSIMIHGHCASIGCYAMTDPYIDEIFTMIYQAFACGQQAINLHIFPFRMNDDHMQLYTTSTYLPFWKNLKQGYDLFEKSHIPPDVSVAGKVYAFKAK